MACRYPRCFGRVIAIFAMALAAVSNLPCRATGLEASHDTGRFHVGFAVSYIYDYSRAWRQQVDTWGNVRRFYARPIRVSIWYPTVANAITQNYSRYIRYVKTGNVDFDAANAFLTARDTSNYLRGDFLGDANLLTRLLNTETGAQYGAKPAPGKFPLLLYAAGWNSFSPDNTLLAERLASHGYVVASVAQLPTSSNQIELAATAEDVTTQVRDLEVAEGLTMRKAFVDPSKVGLIGYSLGGVAALWVAMETGQVRAVVGLDPSFAYSNFVALTEKSAAFDPSRARFPILVLQSGDPAIAATHSPNSRTRWRTRRSIALRCSGALTAISPTSQRLAFRSAAWRPMPNLAWRLKSHARPSDRAYWHLSTPSYRMIRRAVDRSSTAVAPNCLWASCIGASVRPSRPRAIFSDTRTNTDSKWRQRAFNGYRADIPNSWSSTSKPLTPRDIGCLVKEELLTRSSPFGSMC